MKLGYLIIAEQMFTRCLNFTEYEPEAQKELGYVYKDQGSVEAAIECFKKSLELESTPEKAFEIGKLYFSQHLFCEAIEFYNYAVDMSADDVLAIEPQYLSDIYLHRMKCFEEMELLEHAKADYKKILESDPNFIQRHILKSANAKL